MLKDSRRESLRATRKFESNKLVLELTMIAYNILRIIGQELTMIAYNILRIIGQEPLKKKDAPGRLVLSIGRSNRWRFTFKRLYDSFAFIT